MKINFTAFSGISLAIAIIWFGVIHSAKNPIMFLDKHAIILVLGGTLAAALIAFPGKKLYALIDFLFLGMLFPSRKETMKVAEELMQVNYLLRSNPKQLEETKFSHGFVKEVAGLLLDTTLSPEEFENVLRIRSRSILKSYQADAKILNALAKFPPAFGLLGATTGMIEMMSNLGKGGASSIGSAMAIALVATFWGIAIANFILLPLADRAGKMATDDAHIRDMIIEGAKVIKARGSEFLLLNSIRGYLPLTNRGNVKGYNMDISAHFEKFQLIKGGYGKASEVTSSGVASATAAGAPRTGTVTPSSGLSSTSNTNAKYNQLDKFKKVK